MASIGEESTAKETNPAQTQEVTEIKEMYGSDCRVISDIGDFSHIVEIKLPKQKGIHIAFQLEGEKITLLVRLCQY